MNQRLCDIFADQPGVSREFLESEIHRYNTGTNGNYRDTVLPMKNIIANWENEVSDIPFEQLNSICDFCVRNLIRLPRELIPLQ